MELHPVVEAVTSTYLDRVDHEAPGLVEAVYLVGSVAMMDFRRGGLITRHGPSGAASSDIDFIAVTARPVGPDDAARLERAHQAVRQRHRRPFFDGLYLTWTDLRRDPRRLRHYIQAHEGRTRFGDQDPPSPVAWHELARHGVTVRGPDPRTQTIRSDQDALVAWCQENLTDYWARLPLRCRQPTSPWAAASLTGWVTAWVVLGIARSDYTITTGGLTSKTGAGEYARATYGPRWHRIVDEALRIRTGSSLRPLYWNPRSRRRELLAFAEMILDRHIR